MPDFILFNMYSSPFYGLVEIITTLHADSGVINCSSFFKGCLSHKIWYRSFSEVMFSPSASLQIHPLISQSRENQSDLTSAVFDSLHRCISSSRMCGFLFVACVTDSYRHSKYHFCD